MSRIAPKSAFDILGVTPDDDFATIRRAWVRLVKENHPDVVGGDIALLTRKLARFNDAYDSLRWHSPDKVRIRERQADTQPDQRTTQRRHAEPGRHHAAPKHAGCAQGVPTSVPEPEVPRYAMPRRVEDVLWRVAAPGEGVWNSIDAAEAVALYSAIRGICTSAPESRAARRQICS